MLSILDETLVKKQTKPKRNAVSLAQREKEMLKQNGDLYDYDLETGELRKKPDRQRRQKAADRRTELSVGVAKKVCWILIVVVEVLGPGQYVWMFLLSLCAFSTAINSH